MMFTLMSPLKYKIVFILNTANVSHILFLHDVLHSRNISSVLNLSRSSLTTLGQVKEK